MEKNRVIASGIWGLENLVSNSKAIIKIQKFNNGRSITWLRLFISKGKAR